VNKDNAKEGKETESMIKDSIRSRLQAVNELKKKFKIKGELDNTSGSGIYGDKADFRIAFTCGHYIDGNVKGYAVGKNQLVRTSISKFCKNFDLSEPEKKDLERIFLEKAHNKKNYLFTEKDWSKWGIFFKENIKELLKWAFSKQPSREILVLYNKKISLVKIYAMKDVLRVLSKKDIIGPTIGGFNIGKYVSFQRKGGDGNIKTYSKTDIRHPGNNIQMNLVKLTKIDDILKEIEIGSCDLDNQQREPH
jgi:hypothetical protein